MSYEQYDVILMQFPFTEKKGRKQRPAIVLSGSKFNTEHSHSLVAMVTTAANTKWPSDLSIADLEHAGLQTPCVARAKLFTISDDLVIGKVGTLSGTDASAVGRWASSLVSPNAPSK